MKQKKLKETFQGRDIYATNFDQDSQKNFIDRITHEWDEWKIFIEGEWVQTPLEMIRATENLKGDKSVLMVDEKNKTINFMKKSTYELNLDKEE